MALKRIRLGDYIEPLKEKCGVANLDPYEVSGINRDKEFFEPSKQIGEDTSNYQNVPPRYFACNLMHVGRDKVLPIAYNHTNKIKHVSPAYSVFRIKENDVISELYFFLYLKSDERDRFFWFNTDASIRDGMTWDDLCNVEINVPDLPTQEKFVKVYLSMLENQKNYESGLEDLKLVCDGYIDNLKNCNKKIGPYIQRNTKRNDNAILGIGVVKGFNNDGQFIKPMRLFSGDIKSFKIIGNKCFVYNSRINAEIKKLSVALNEGNDLLVSPAYESFYVKDDNSLYPFYLYMLLQRESFARKVLFDSFGSSTIVFGFEELSNIEIPIPDITVQKSISNIYMIYKKRWNINEKLKQQIKDICPILIKGSIEEAK